MLQSLRIAISRHCFYAALSFIGFLAAGCAPVSHWPPAVTSVSDIEQLPTTQRDIRAIDIGDTELRLIVERFPNLDYLYLNSNSKITDAGLIGIQNLENLRQVVINDGSELSDNAITALASLPALTELIIDEADGLTDASLDVLGEKTNLRLLYLNGCSQFQSEAKDKIRGRLDSCKIRFD